MMPTTLSRFRWQVAGVLAAAMLMGTMAERPAEAAVSPKRAAARLATKAAKAEKRKQYQDAASLYREAFDLNQDYKYLFLVGKNCEAAQNVECALSAYKVVMDQDTKPARAADARTRRTQLEEAQKVSLLIRVSPDGTEVDLDGSVLGKAAVSTVRVAPGKHVLTFRNPGYGEERREFEAVRGLDLPPLDVVLRLLEGQLVVTVDKPGAHLMLDGKDVGVLPLQTPLKLATGDHALRIELQNFEPLEKTIQVKSGETSIVNLAMKAIVRDEWWKVPRSSLDEAMRPTGPNVCGHCDPSQPTMGAAFTGPRAVTRLGVEMGAGMGWEGGASQYKLLFAPIIELAAAPRWFSIGLVPRFNVDVGKAGGKSKTNAGLSTADIGFKITPYDNLRGTAISIMILGKARNERPDGFHIDSVGPGGGVIGTVSIGPVRLMGSAYAVHPFKVTDYGFARTDVGWFFGPALDIINSGHHVFLGVGGQIPIIKDKWTHNMDGGIGYAFSANGVKCSFMLFMPITHRSDRKLTDMSMGAQGLWEP